MLWTVPVLPKVVLIFLIQALSGLIQFVFAQDPLLYLLLVVETTFAVGRNFLEQHDEYLGTILSQDPSHYDYWLDKGARRAWSQLAFLPGVLPWAPQEKAKEEQVVGKRGTIYSFIKDPADWEFRIKWRPYRAMSIPLDTIINREDICRCYASSVIKQELEFFASVQSTQRLLFSVRFVLRYYFLVKCIVLIVHVVFIIATAL